MKKSIIFLLLISFFSIVNGSVDYDYRFRENILKIEVAHSYINNYLYISKSKMTSKAKAAFLKINPLKEVKYFNIKIEHINIVPGEYKLYLKDRNNKWILIEGLYNNYIFESFENLKIKDYFQKTFIILKLEFNSYYIGMLKKIQLRYYNQYVRNKLHLEYSYQGVEKDKNIISVKGYARIEMNEDTLERVKKERVAKVRAYRKLALLIKIL